MTRQKILDETDEEMESKFSGYLWKPQAVGEIREGVFSRMETVEGINDDSVLYHFNEDKENLEQIDDPDLHWKMWGATILDKWMAKAEPGLKTWVTFEGKQKNKTNKFYSNHYVVEQDVPDEGGDSTSSSSSDDVYSRDDVLRFEAKKHLATARGMAGSRFKGVVSKLITMKNDALLTSENSFSQEEEFEMALQVLEDEKRLQDEEDKD